MASGPPSAYHKISDSVRNIALAWHLVSTCTCIIVFSIILAKVKDTLANGNFDGVSGTNATMHILCLQGCSQRVKWRVATLLSDLSFV